MIAVDTNILVYAHREDAAFHTAAEAKVRELAEGRQPWAIPWPCAHEFFAVVTHPRIYEPPTSCAGALDQIDAWFESPTLTLLAEGPAYWKRLRSLLEQGKVTGPMVHDARIASLCLANGVETLLSADRDFNRFPDLSTRNPLI